MDGEESPPGVFSSVVRLVLIVLLLFTLALAALSFPLGFYAVVSGKLSSMFTYTSYALTYLWIGPLPAVLPFEVPIGGAFAAVSTIYVAMFLFAAGQKTRPLEAMRNSLRVGVGGLFGSPLLLTVLSIGFVVFTTSWVTIATEAAGAPVGNPFSNVDALFEFTSLSIAPLREEVGFRVLLIGVVALVLSLGRPRRHVLKALWRPSAAYEGLAVGAGTYLIVWAATLFSSVTFGVCHVVCGGTGWDWGKIPEATYGGLVLGYLYVKYGFHVAVLTHWGVDYFTSAYAFFGQAVYGINWNSTKAEFWGQYVIDFDLLLLFGLVSFLAVAYVGVKWLATRKRPLSPGTEPVFEAPPTGGTAGS